MGPVLYTKLNAELTDASAELVNKFGGKSVVNDFTTAPTLDGDRITVNLYGVSGKVTEEEAVKSAVNKFITDMGAVKATANYPAHDGNFDCEYTAEISTLKVASRQHPDKSAWTVAIVVTQTASAAA